VYLRRDQRWVFGGGSVLGFVANIGEPAKLDFELRDHQLEHPDCFVMGMADFFQDRVECGALSLQLALQKFFALV
jgi:hypothetical protein